MAVDTVCRCKMFWTLAGYSWEQTHFTRGLDLPTALFLLGILAQKQIGLCGKETRIRRITVSDERVNGDSMFGPPVIPNELVLSSNYPWSGALLHLQGGAPAIPPVIDARYKGSLIIRGLRKRFFDIVGPNGRRVDQGPQMDPAFAQMFNDWLNELVQIGGVWKMRCRDRDAPVLVISDITAGTTPGTLQLLCANNDQIPVVDPVTGGPVYVKITGVKWRRPLAANEVNPQGKYLVLAATIATITIAGTLPANNVYVPTGKVQRIAWTYPSIIKATLLRPAKRNTGAGGFRAPKGHKVAQ